MSGMHVRESRIRSMIEGLERFTATPGAGTTRLTYSEEHRQARAFLLERMDAAGLTAQQDAVGNLFGRLEGRNPEWPPLVIGSHFDSVPRGGAFDGPAGVVAGLETAFVFRDLGLVPDRPLEVVAMIEEEGSRFGGGLLGSRLLTGQVGRDTLDEMRDSSGTTLARAMRDFGLDPDRAMSVARREGDIHAFLELHIEQGPVLEEHGVDVGLVSGIVSICQLEVVVRGAAGHAGTTPMPGRRDALVAASSIISSLPGLVAQADPRAVGTVGRMLAEPGGANVIPDAVTFSVDIRAPESATVSRIVERLNDALATTTKGGIECSMAEKLFVAETPMSASIYDILAASAEEAGIASRRMSSGAGHDAMILSKITQTGLVFVPSRDGISHTPEEWTDFDQLARGIEVIFRAARKMTGS